MVKNFGQELAYASADTNKIILFVTLRVLFVCIIIFSGMRANPIQSISGVSSLMFLIVVILGVFIWAFFPLIYLKSYIKFYENKIEINFTVYDLYEIGEVTFLEHKGALDLFSRFYMCTNVKDFNITYLKDVKKVYNRTYLKRI